MDRYLCISGRTRVLRHPRLFLIALLLLAIVLGRAVVHGADAHAAQGGDPEPASACEGDSDCDGLPDVREDANGNGQVDAGETDPKNPDTDGDGLLDGEEGDRDGDGKPSPDETDPLNPDTDGDGVPDGEERRLGTKPNLCDTDADGLSDGVEAGSIQPEDKGGCHGLTAAGTNYRKPHVMDPLNPDSDGDGLKDGEEDSNGNGWVDPEESDPSIVDSDSDGLEDGVEALGDFDGDGVPDYDARLIKAGPKCSPPESIADVDCDGIPNAVDTDSDNDACPDSLEGGWIDANSNGIPDVFDNQYKSCPEAAAAPGGGGRPSESEEKDGGEGGVPGMMFAGDGRDSAACALLSPRQKAPLAPHAALFAILAFLASLSVLIWNRCYATKFG